METCTRENSRMEIVKDKDHIPGQTTVFIKENGLLIR